MVIVNRKQGERIVLGSNIEVVVLAVSGQEVKLGFEGPLDMRIQREELRWHSVPQQTKPIGQKID
jgi:carbon storage regulator